MIAVLLSTYNGENYIAEQIDSLLSQTYKDIRIFIRDDNSTDRTGQIIDEYVFKYPNKINRVDKGGNNLGCGQSFMWLLENTHADYYMYCDQDDYWLPEKVGISYNKIKQIESENNAEDKPVVVFSDAIIVDESLSVLYDSLWESNNRNPEYAKSFYKCAVYRQAALGCTMIFNETARKMALSSKMFPNKRGLHDRLIVFLCSKRGIVDYIETPLIKYRQHSSNVTSYLNRTISSRSELIKEWYNHPTKHYRSMMEIYKQFKYLPFHVSYLYLVYMYLKKWIYK